MKNPETGLDTSHDQSFETARKVANDDVRIDVWEAPLNIESAQMNAEVFNAAQDEPHVEIEDMFARRSKVCREGLGCNSCQPWSRRCG